MNRKQYKRYGFVVTDCDYDKCNKRFKNNYNKFVNNNNNNNSDNYENRQTVVDKEVLNQSIDSQMNDKQVMNDKSVANYLKTRLLGYFAFSDRYTKKQRKEIREFMKSSQFYLRLANGLPNRTLKQIHDTARNNFHKLKYINDLSDDVVNSIKHYHSIYGAKWTKIAEKFMCYPLTLKWYYSNNFNKNGEPYDKGKWSIDEDKQLLDAMRRVLNTDDLKQHIYTKQLPFSQIRDLSGLNRNENMISKRWRRHIRWQLAQWDQLEDSWSKRDTARLIYCLFKYEFTDESAIDWDEIKEKFANISSFNALMKNWRLIKQTVPSFDSKSYKQIIDFLYHNFLPQFLKTDDDLKEFEMFFDN
ncbi:transcription termination factor 1-like [Oppia nitens]|uniref:transcription termination factor 1-like n=1 Tax=Oppia nitens TaxID=1686743 RepID=UPI0023DC9EC3|nr:transcription termination factor 1-like [Oppia nitens]